MNSISKALGWAAAMLFVAIGGRAGLMDQGAVTTLITIIPLLAWMSIRGRANCCFGRGEASSG
ncbi:MAG: hypothetical protein ACXWI4_10870 [Croceibacterium sp.]